MGDGGDMAEPTRVLAEEYTCTCEAGEIARKVQKIERQSDQARISRASGTVRDCDRQQRRS